MKSPSEIYKSSFHHVLSGRVTLPILLLPRPGRVTLHLPSLLSVGDFCLSRVKLTENLVPRPPLESRSIQILVKIPRDGVQIIATFPFDTTEIYIRKKIFCEVMST